MSIESISDVLTRITSIEQQLQQLNSGSLGAGLAVGGNAGAATSGSVGAGSSTTFANQLAQAQGTQSIDTPTTVSAGLPSGAGVSFGSLTDSALGSGTTQVTAGVSGGVALPASASTLLTSGQQQFATTLAADTGLNPSVVTSWLLAEESGGAAQARQAAGNNDWLNIGYTDSGTYGVGDPVWSDPVSAANATAAWMRGQDSVAGYGTASSGIQAILSSVGQDPAAQIQAIQQSGWSSSGYPSLGSLYTQATGA